LGFSYYYGDNNFAAALKEFEIAQRGLPNESEVYLAIGAIQRRQGKWSESRASLEKAVSLNPKDMWSLQNLSFNYAMLRNYDAAIKTIDRALAVDPTALEPLEVKSKLAIAGSGDFSFAEKAFESVKSLPLTTEQKLKRSPDAADLHIQLAKVLAYLGEKEAALAEAQRATELQPESKDAFGGPEITAGVAEVYAILGDKERAIEILDGLLSRPSSITLQVLN